MSEELRTEELQNTAEHTETMADYEDHFDDANPWNRVLTYLEEKTVLPVKIEKKCKRPCHCHGRRTARIYSGIQTVAFLY